MPDNYIPVYNVPSVNKVLKILNKADEKIEDIINSIKQKNITTQHYGIFRIFFDWASRMLYNAFVDTLEKRNFAKNFWVDKSCNGCGICEKVCPVSNVVLTAEKTPGWSDKCTFCLACISWCPQKAIQYKKATIKKSRYNNPRISLDELKI